MKRAEKWLGLVAIVALLGFGATTSFAEEAEAPAAPQLAAAAVPQAPAPALTSEAVACEPGDTATAENTQGSEATKVDLAFLGTGGACSNCGQCNCNGDDDCYFVCGHVANCHIAICPCGTCRGVCEC